MAVIQSNPEQSKHLATATMSLHGLSLDFVNLRSETYADTRIPQIDFGTPEEDAKRRDFTVNSLFYNLNTDEVKLLSDTLSRHQDFLRHFQSLNVLKMTRRMDFVPLFWNCLCAQILSP